MTGEQVRKHLTKKTDEQIVTYVKACLTAALAFEKRDWVAPSDENTKNRDLSMFAAETGIMMLTERWS